MFCFIQLLAPDSNWKREASRKLDSHVYYFKTNAIKPYYLCKLL